MKKILCLIVLLFFCVGCASQSAYTAYANAITAANAYKKAPGITQELDAQGKLVKQTITLPDNGVQVAQIKDSEWVNPISQFLNLGILGGTSWLVMREASNMIRATRSNTYDSHNTAGGNYGDTAGENMAGGNITTTSTPTMTTTTTTETAEVGGNYGNTAGESMAGGDIANTSTPTTSTTTTTETTETTEVK